MDTNKTTIKISDLNENQRRRHYFERHLPNLLLKIDEYNDWNKLEKFSILLYKYHNNIKLGVICSSCNKETKFISFNKGYNKYCSKKCVMSDKELIKKRNKKSKKTNIEKYGVDNPMKSDIIKNKVKKTNIEKYGVDNPMKSDIIKNKVKKTNIEKYGEGCYLRTDEFKIKSKKANIEKYGSDHHMKNGDIINKIIKNNITKWGVDNYSKTDEFKSKMDKYYNSPSFEENIEKQRSIRNKKEVNFYSSYNKKYKLVKIENNILFFICPDCKECYTISKQLYYLRNKNNNVCCTICNNTDGRNTSYKEKELLSYIKEIYDGNIIENYRDKYEIDVYLPDLKIGLEFNGIWFHSENFKNKDYHINKTIHFKNKEISIFHIWEDDWDYKQDIIKSMICYKIGKIDNKIGARNCSIGLVNGDDSKKFLDNNHLQGNVPSSVRIGLFNNNELVSLLTIGKSRNKSNDMEILRFCNKLNTVVSGSFSKLFSFYKKNYEHEK